MTLPFLAAKTRLPTPTSNLVPRPRLFAALDTCLNPNVQVMLVAAPAGAGKTTLLAQWLGHLPSNLNVGWLSLDEGDNSLARFLGYLFAAIPHFDSDFAAQVESNPNINAEQGVTYLVEQAAESDSNFLLVLDDYHTITALEVHQALKLLIDHLPPNLRLVIAGRVEPPLPLARLRARGQLVEVRAADLRFSVDEVAAFLARFAGLESLAGHDLLSKRLADSTEGWAAGIQMSALALRGELSLGNRDQAQVLERFVDGLGGSHRYILDYLLDEVLSRESERVREFLLRTCLLERFNADLCAALCSEEMDAAAAQSLLEELERSNLFIVPLDGQREWFRYHHLFADVLQKQLLHNHAGLAPELHRRAADWFERHGMIEEAISHAQRAGDPSLLQKMAEKYVLATILRGQIATANRWLDSLPSEMLLSSPRLCLDRAWALTFTSQTESAIPYLQQAKTLAHDIPEIRAEVLGLQSYGKSVYGLTEEAVQLATLALEASPRDHSFLQCINHLFFASALVRDGKLDEALQEYRSIRVTCQNQQPLAGFAMLEADFLQYAAVYMNARNQSRQAKELLNNAIRSFENAEGNRGAAALYLYVGLGTILFIENNLTEAERALEKGLQLDPFLHSLAAIDGWLTLWWVKIGQGDHPAARHILRDLEPSIRGRDEKLHRLFVLTGALQDLLENKIGAATEKMSQLGFTDDVNSALASVTDSELIGWRSNEYLVYARVLAAQGKPALSLRVLKRIAQVTQAHGLNWVMYRTWITQAAVLFEDAQKDSALEIMARLLDETSRLESGAARVYLSAGESARALLKEAQRIGLRPQHVANLLAEFPPEAPPAKSSSLPEALTERELDVLRLMAEGLRNQEIGAKLYISLNTIRYHTGNIFGKLGVSSRTAAVVRAREMGIL